jgi:hypothetical protein
MPLNRGLSTRAGARALLAVTAKPGHFTQPDDVTERNLMNKLIAVLFAAMFAAVSFQAVAQDKKPTAEQCKKDPKMKGCEQMKK